MSIDDSLLGIRVQGNYEFELQSLLGSGAFGNVYRAIRLGKPPVTVAVKIFNSRGDTEMANLRRELSALLSVDSPYVPKVLDYDLTSRYKFMAMELYPYGSLSQMIKNLGVLSETAGWKLLHDLLQAVKAAHLASLLHLDIKPPNVLLSGRGGFVLGDFGISQALMVTKGEALTPSIGTPFYHAPEQRELEFDLFDTRTDLYGIGATVWAALCRAKLDMEQVRRIKCGERIPPAREVRPELDAQLSSILQRLTAPEQSMRPGGAGEVLADVLQIMKGAPMTESAPLGRFLEEEEIEEVISNLMDPYWVEVIRKESDHLTLLSYEDGEYLCRLGGMEHTVHILLRGKVVVERDGKLLALESREGQFLGEVAALTGSWRTANVQARGPVVTAVFNAATFEEFLSKYPPAAIRIIRALSERVSRESQSSSSLDDNLSFEKA